MSNSKMNRKRKPGKIGDTNNDGPKKSKASNQLVVNENKLHYPNLDETQKAKLNELLDEIHTETSIDNSIQEMQEIKTAVRTMIHRIVTRVNKRGYFKISRVELCGSMREETAVWKFSRPTGEIHTEFDFLGVLDCPSDIIDRIEECGQCVELKKQPVNTTVLLENLRFPRQCDSDRERCDNLFWREINTCLGSDCNCFSVTLDDKDENMWSFTYKLAEGCTPDYRCDKCVVEMPTGILRVNHSLSVGKDRDEGNTNCSLLFSWTSKAKTLSAYDIMLQEEPRKINTLAIHVDFLPAIEILKSGPGTTAREHDFFLVPKRCNVCDIEDIWTSWRKSNCLAEIAHIINDMSEKHRKCYKIIKYILSIVVDIVIVEKKYLHLYVHFYVHFL